MANQATSDTSKSNMTATSKMPQRMCLPQQEAHQHSLLEAEENAIMLGKHMILGEVQTRRWVGSNKVVERIPGHLVCNRNRNRSPDIQGKSTDQIRPRLAWEEVLAMDNHLLLLVATSLLTQRTLPMEDPLRNRAWLGSLRV